MKKAVTLRFDEETYNKICIRQEQMGISFSAVVRLAVEAGLKTDLTNVAESFATPSTDETIKEAIIALAKATSNEDVISNILGEPIDSFSREEIPKTPKKTKKERKAEQTPVQNTEVAPPAAKPVTKDSTKTPEPAPVVTPKQSPAETAAPIPVVNAAKPIAKPQEEPQTVIDETEENEEENVIEVAETTDVAFSKELLDELDNLLGF